MQGRDAYVGGRTAGETSAVTLGRDRQFRGPRVMQPTSAHRS
jgi:hypothetical protein